MQRSLCGRPRDLAHELRHEITGQARRERVAKLDRARVRHLEVRCARDAVELMQVVGKDAARDFYRFLTANFRTEGEEPVNRLFDGETMILEQNMTGAVIGELLSIPGNGRKVTFRILHIFDFRNGLISREQVWIDSAAIVAQLTAP